MNCPAPVEISYENMHFLITHNPTNKYGVMTLVRVCDATYDKAPVEKEGIHVLDWVPPLFRPYRVTSGRCHGICKLPGAAGSVFSMLMHYN
uniref:Uncharacterized protein n=1 Tax=Colobus angolensis palliatus TaxID=336983 RepID=A0A2K5HTD4_COLAP